MSPGTQAGQGARFLLFAPAGSSSPPGRGMLTWELLTSTDADKEEEGQASHGRDHREGPGQEPRQVRGPRSLPLPLLSVLRREPGRPLATTSEPGHQAAGRRVRAWSRPRLELMINQPSEAAQQLRPASRRAQAQGGSGAGSRGRWRPLCSPLGCGRRRRPAGPASEEQGAATQCPLSHGAGRRYGALGGRVMEAERAPSTEPGLATEASLACLALGTEAAASHGGPSGAGP
ncbi:uncharacterized protein LOC122428163 [Cervus canadensis]|uniref:uncharacterized protein LOC122428163 n=1 Tax=Cervus canadensis TaxID=1574408 RepID=UPI001CA3520D|nr:uncharacterized protein LOC122428163 [Cervus canadensis]